MEWSLLVSLKGSENFKIHYVAPGDKDHPYIFPPTFVPMNIFCGIWH